MTNHPLKEYCIIAIATVTQVTTNGDVQCAHNQCHQYTQHNQCHLCTQPMSPMICMHCVVIGTNGHNCSQTEHTNLLQPKGTVLLHTTTTTTITTTTTTITTTTTTITTTTTTTTITTTILLLLVGPTGHITTACLAVCHH